MMRRFSALAVATIVAALLHAACGAAQAQDDTLDCAAFFKNPDGSWTARQAVYIPGTNRVSRIGGVFRPGVPTFGVDVVATLDKACPNPAMPAPAATAVQQPFVSLARFADANGNIDVTRLTCGDIADTSNQETDLLLAWYRSAPTAPGKKRLVNLAGLRSAVEALVGYCKANRAVNLVQVMDHFLK